MSACVNDDKGRIMRKVTLEQNTQKREEIINACEQLYQTRDKGTALKAFSMNNYDMEANSRQELLTAFKQS